MENKDYEQEAWKEINSIIENASNEEIKKGSIFTDIVMQFNKVPKFSNISVDDLKKTINLNVKQLSQAPKKVSFLISVCKMFFSGKKLEKHVDAVLTKYGKNMEPAAKAYIKDLVINNENKALQNSLKDKIVSIAIGNTSLAKDNSKNISFKLNNDKNFAGYENEEVQAQYNQIKDAIDRHNSVNNQSNDSKQVSTKSKNTDFKNIPIDMPDFQLAPGYDQGNGALNSKDSLESVKGSIAKSGVKIDRNGDKKEDLNQDQVLTSTKNAIKNVKQNATTQEVKNTKQKKSGFVKG